MPWTDTKQGCIRQQPFTFFFDTDFPFSLLHLLSIIELAEDPSPVHFTRNTAAHYNLRILGSCVNPAHRHCHQLYTESDSDTSDLEAFHLLNAQCVKPSYPSHLSTSTCYSTCYLITDIIHTLFTTSTVINHVKQDCSAICWSTDCQQLEGLAWILLRWV